MSSRLTKRWARITLTVFTVLVMILIFFFSSEEAVDSDHTSGVFAQRVVRIVRRDYDTLDPAAQKLIYDEVQWYIRKAAHFSEFCMLGFLMRLCLESWAGKRKWLSPVSWLLSALYAMTDEAHQLLIDGRAGQWQDVGIDSCGALTGVLLACLILFLVRRRKPSGG